MESFCWDIIKEIITIVLTCVGLYIAGSGLSTWKKQIKGVKEFETSHNLHCSVLRLREAIKQVRHPAIWPSESQKAVQFAREKYPHKNDEELEKDQHGYVYEMRWEQISKATIDMESYLLAAEVLWGKDILNLIKPLMVLIAELNISLKKNFQHIPELDPKKYEERDGVIYGRLGDDEENDVFGEKINSAIQNIDDYLKTKI